MGSNIVQGLLGVASIAEMLDAFAQTLGTWGNIIILILGIAMIIVGVYQLAKALISHGKGQPPNWFIIIGLLLIGGLLIGTSIGGVADMTNVPDVSNIMNGNAGTANSDASGWSRNTSGG
jgi:hypothetical protein